MLNFTKTEQVPSQQVEVLTDEQALNHTETKKMRKRSRFDLTTRRNLMGYWFVLPFVIGLFFIYLPALWESFQFSTHEILKADGKYSLATHAKGTWHFYDVAINEDPEFLRGIYESMGSMLLNVAIIIIYALIMATILNRNISGKGFYRAILFLPVIVATGVIANAENFSITTEAHKLLEQDELASVGGIFADNGIEALLMSLNFNETLTGIVVSAIGNLYSIVSCSGVQLIIFLAGLQSISPAIYESATVEGATWWEGFWKITIPMISPLILVNTVYTIVDSFTQYGNKVMSAIYDMISNGDFENASARSFMFLAVVGVLIAIVVPIINKFVFYENK